MIFRYIRILLVLTFVCLAPVASAATSQDVTALWAVVQSLQKEISGQQKTQGATAISATLPADIDPESSTTSACITLTKDIRYRSKDATTNGEVSLLQDFLNTQGVFNQESTGYAGLLTIKAIKDFQSKYGISPTGFVGPLTRAKVKEVSCGGTSTASVPVTPTTPSQPTPQTTPQVSADTAKSTTAASSGEPVLSMIYPTTANPGVSIYLYGENFSGDDLKVYVDNLVLTPKIISPTVAMIIVPEHFVGGTYTFTVTMMKNNVKTKGLPLTIVASEATQKTSTPVLSSVNPASGPLGTSITLLGKGLFNASLVEIYKDGTLVGKADRLYVASNGTAVTFTLADYLFTTVPSTGTTLEMAVLSDGVRSNKTTYTVTTSGATTPVPPPVVTKSPKITSITPNPARAGETLSIIGENFDSTSVIEINASPASGTVLSSTKATLVLPTTTIAGSYVVTVRNRTTNEVLKSNGVQITISNPNTQTGSTSVQPPVISSVDSQPASPTPVSTNQSQKTPSISLVTPNPVNPGVTVYVYGDGFDSSSVVEINAAAYPTTVLSQFVSAVRIPDTFTTGTYTITVRNGTVKSNGVTLTVSR